MTETISNQAATDCIFDTIVGLMLPFFLAAADGNTDTAKAAIRHLMNIHNPGTAAELDLVGRIIGFSIVALDNLRLSVTPGLSETKLLRYRSNAATLTRASDQARKILAASKAGREVTRDVPRPTIAAAPPAPKPVNPVRTAPSPTAAASRLPPAAANPLFNLDHMLRNARIDIDKFSKHGAAPSALMSNTAILTAARTQDTIDAVRRASAK